MANNFQAQGASRMVRVAYRSPAQLTEELVETRERHRDVLEAYHRVWYDAGHFTWGLMGFLGVGTMKSPSDLWMFHNLLVEHRPQTIIETGTHLGGSALWFATLMELLGIDGQVITIDMEDRRHVRVRQHRRIHFIKGNSVEHRVYKQVVARAFAHPKRPRPLMVVLDSDHSDAHVREELGLYAPLCNVGERLIVEDTNVSWKDDGGASAAVRAYSEAHPGEWAFDVACERFLHTLNPGGWLVRAEPCPHGVSSPHGKATP